MGINVELHRFDVRRASLYFLSTCRNTHLLGMRVQLVIMSAILAMKTAFSVHCVNCILEAHTIVHHVLELDNTLIQSRTYFQRIVNMGWT